mgnify:FL=1
MTTSMERVIGESVKKTNQTFLRRYVDDYCKALTKNFLEHTKRSLEYNIQNDPENTYAANRMIEVMQGKANLNQFRYYEGKKYYKVVMEIFDEREGRYRDSSVHSFVDIKTGDVYKPASWKAPAKHVRYSFSDLTDFRFLNDWRNLDWAGGYLYLR